MQKLIYKSTQKATKDIAGITQVDLDVDGAVTALGTVENFSGAGTFKAVLTNGTTLSDGHITKKQAGGALKKRHDGDPSPVVAAKPVATPTIPVVEEPEDAIPAREEPINAEPAPVVATLSDEIEEDYEPSHGGPLGDMLLDQLDDPDDLLEIPAFLRRLPVALAEEM